MIQNVNTIYSKMYDPRNKYKLHYSQDTEDFFINWYLSSQLLDSNSSILYKLTEYLLDCTQ
jgi:hypothetical protein